MSRLLRPRSRSAAIDVEGDEQPEARVELSPIELVRQRRRSGRTGSEMRAEHNAKFGGTANPLALDSARQETTGATTGLAPLDFSGPTTVAANDQFRWVPIGPSVVRLGQAEAFPNVTGRITDVAISPNGRRIYAGSAKGGLWYSGDGGATWDPVGNWANAARGVGGNLTGLSIGAIIVDFKATAADDHVMVGTGERSPRFFATGNTAFGGVGFLTAKGPAIWQLGNPQWAVAAGTTANAQAFVGQGVYRIVRRPGSTGGETAAGAARDVVVACTSNGAFAGAATGAGYVWKPITAVGANRVTDAVWIPHGANGRLFLAVQGGGVVFCDDVIDPANAAFAPTSTAVAGINHTDRASLAANDDSSRVYVLGQDATPQAVVWRIPNPTGDPSAMPPTPAPAADPSFNDPVANGMNNATLWGQSMGVTGVFGFYCHGFDACGTGANDQVFIGGATAATTDDVGWCASLWGFGFDEMANTLVPIRGISDSAIAGADQPGLVGNTVHPDVHAIRIVETYREPVTNVALAANVATVTVATSTAGLSVGDVIDVSGAVPAVFNGSFAVTALTATTISYDRTTADVAALASAGTLTARSVWVGCDGGVYRSLRSGASNTFVHRNAGLAVIEAGFVANHPTSRHYAMLGAQDNGVQTRVGETVWQLIMLGDGGGVAFHQTASQDVIGQFTNNNWNVRPRRNGVDQIDMPQNGGSNFYSGVDAIGQRAALGTDLVLVSDNPLLRAQLNTWVVLPSPANTGAPARGAWSAGAAAFGTTGLGNVVTVKWADGTNLLALYQNGVVQYSDQGGGIWNSTVVQNIPAAALASDLAPVPGAVGSFYVTTARQWSVPDPNAMPVANVNDTCFYFDQPTGQLFPTGLDAQLMGEHDPATAVVVDQAPGPSTRAYVGTAIGVWQGDRAANNRHVWTQRFNGTPDAVVQDLAIWSDSANPAAPRLLRAALQSRGIWEVDLGAAGPPGEPQRTYVRTHSWDGRREFPTPLLNPRRRPSAAPVSALASPDIVVRPDVPAVPPRWRGLDLTQENSRLTYQLWTFQTAFRWRYPAVVANGRWSRALADLVNRQRSNLGLGPGWVSRTVWNDVVGATDSAGRLFVYRAPWTDAANPNLLASEADLIDLVVPRRNSREVWQVYREPNIVEVLLHHRDSRPIDPNPLAPAVPQNAFALMLWRSAATADEIASADTSLIVAYAQSLFGGAPNAVPDGWNVALNGADPLHRLGAPLSARFPRAVPIPLDLTVDNGVPENHPHVIVIALAGSDVDQFSAVPAGATDNPSNLVRNWPHAAARYFRVFDRP